MTSDLTQRLASRARGEQDAARIELQRLRGILDAAHAALGLPETLLDTAEQASAAAAALLRHAAAWHALTTAEDNFDDWPSQPEDWRHGEPAGDE